MCSDINGRPAKLTEYVKLFVISGLYAYFAGGFVAGMVWAKCDDIDPAARFIGNILRPIGGIAFSLWSACFFGFPPENEAGSGPRLNVWPYIFGCWIVIFVIACLKRRLKRTNKQNDNAS